MGSVIYNVELQEVIKAFLKDDGYRPLWLAMIESHKELGMFHPVHTPFLVAQDLWIAGVRTTTEGKLTWSLVEPYMKNYYESTVKLFKDLES